MAPPARRTQAERAAVAADVAARAAAHRRGPAEGLQRSMVDELRLVGHTRDEALAVLTEVLGRRLALHVYEDLPSYGEWAR